MNGKIAKIKISEKGGLQFYNLETLKKALVMNPNFEGFITFHEIAQDRSSFHKLYRWWVNLIADHTGDSFHNTDSCLCEMFLSYEHFNKLSKKTITLVKSKDDLSYREWISFFRKVNHLCMMELDFVDLKTGDSTLPIPNNLKGKI